LYINASDENGIDTIRGKISGFAKTRSLDGKLKVVLLDEGDQISLDAQKALRNIIEEFSLNTRFIITCNYLFKIIPPIQSRTQIINLSPPIDEILKRVKKILQKENISINQEQKNLLLAHIKKNVPDIRRIVNDIQKFSITGKLDIKTEAIDDFVKSLFSDIIKNTNLTNLRKKIIENEKLFSNDYRHLLKQMFEIVFRENIDQSKKAESLLILAKGMETDCIVVDKEINCFSTLIKLQQALVATT
jgi:DNA polymerase III delta prime subunit